jgi:Domain of unknown function (DUF4394)
MSKLSTCAGAALLALALAADPASAEPAVGLVGNTALIKFDTATLGVLSGHQITGMQSTTEEIVGIDVRPATGELYAVTVPLGVPMAAMVRTYKVDPDTGVFTFVGSISGTVPGAGDAVSGIDFNPTVDRIRMVNVSDENFRVNPNNGALSADDTNLNPAGSQIVDLAYDRNTPRANAVTIPTTVYAISRATSSLVTQGGINGAGPGGGPNGGMIATVGPLGVALDAGSDAGLDISANGVAETASGTAYASLRSGGISRLYTIDLATGAATLVGALPADMRDIAILPTPTPIPTPAPPAAPAPASPDVAPPTATLTASRSISLAALLKSGIKVTIVPNEPARIELALLGTVTRANLRAAFNLTLASRTLALAGGARSVRLKPSRKLVGKPRKAFKLRVRLIASDAAGNRRTFTKTITVKPRKARK